MTLGKILNFDFFISKTVTVKWKRGNKYVKHLPSMPTLQEKPEKFLPLLVKAIVIMNASFLLDTDVLGRYINAIRH